MRVKNFQAFKEETESPGQRNQPARDGWCEGYAMKFVAAIREQTFNLCWTDAMRLRVGGVEPEVVPEDQSVGFEDAEHLIADFLSYI